jgi:WhiB family transcriptional regulator, redox-sensing transcriptional regulator
MSHWSERAACAGTPLDLWFPPVGKSDKRAEAIKICSTCPVRDECLTDAMRVEDRYARFGIRGGLTPRKRWQLSRELASGRITA